MPKTRGVGAKKKKIFRPPIGLQRELYEKISVKENERG